MSKPLSATDDVIEIHASVEHRIYNRSFGTPSIFTTEDVTIRLNSAEILRVFEEFKARAYHPDNHGSQE